MQKIILIILYLLSIFCIAQPSRDTISFDFFYKKELKAIINQKQRVKHFPKNFDEHFKLAGLYNDLNIEDSAYHYYYKLYNSKDTYSDFNTEKFNQLLFKLHKIASCKSEYKKDNRSFLNLLYKNALEDEHSDKWLAHYYNEIAKDYFVDSLQLKKAEYYFKKAQGTKFYQEDKEFQSDILLNLGNFYSCQKEFVKSKMYLDAGLQIASKVNDNIRKTYFNINLAVMLKKQEKYSDALNTLNHALKIKFEKYKPKIYRILYKNKSICYHELGDSINKKKSDLIIKKLDSLIEDFSKNSNFYEIDTKYQVQEKNAQIITLKSKFNQNKTLYLSLIFGVFLLALYSFVRWKKEDKMRKNAVLETQSVKSDYFQTVEELKKTKQLVIQDHIILKNKAKVNLEDLIYIKSEDHYLQLVTNKKNEFVREKIITILNQLPPNFVRCHRSFIVNKNQVKTVQKTFLIMNDNSEIPISRGFKMEE